MSGEAPSSLGRLGDLEVRLARNPSEVRQAQALRYRVFYEEMSALPDLQASLSGRDEDEFDRICDHMLVIDHGQMRRSLRRGLRPEPRVVGTYRLLRRDIADRYFGFYSASEFDVQGVQDRFPDARILELGRSCVLASHRTKRTIEMLWQGVWNYIRHYQMDAMMGCASMEGTDPDQLALPLSYLHHFALAPDPWRVRALPTRHVAMDRLPREAVHPRGALKTLPTLIKGYLRLGAFTGDGAVIDRQFGTTDVFMILPVAGINARYFEYFGAPAEEPG
ncbi:MAG: GNAT family N-acyltransferase [Pseudomonadota bacterium]